MKIKKLLKKYTTNAIDDNCYYNAEDMIDFAKYVLKEKLTLTGVGSSIILKEMYKQMDEYYEDHNHCNIVTLDLDDVYNMLEKSEKKAKKKLSKK